MESLTSTKITATDWSSLPDEIWSAIADIIANDRFDATRFRSVCKSFRSIIPKFTPNSSLPRFIFSLRSLSSIESFVSFTTVYKISRPNGHGHGWMVKVDFAGSDQIRLFDALSCRSICQIPELVTFRLSDFEISEVEKSYSLRYIQGSATIAGIEKIIVISPAKSAIVFIIYDGGKLGFAGDGDGEITQINNRVTDYNDIAVFRGQPYVVDRWGIVSWIDSSMNLIQFSPPMSNDGPRKHLVVSSGELFVVERYLDESLGDQSPDNIPPLFNSFLRHRRRRRDFPHPRSVDFKVFKLDEEWGRWVEVKSLGNTSFILTYDSSFSIIASEFDGFEPNCIYYTDQFNIDCAVRQLGRLGGCVFNLEYGTIEDLEITPGYANILHTNA